MSDTPAPDDRDEDPGAPPEAAGGAAGRASRAEPATPGIVPYTETGAGTGAAAPPLAADIRPIESGLVGGATGEFSAATPKAAAADARPTDDDTDPASAPDRDLDAGLPDAAGPRGATDAQDDPQSEAPPDLSRPAVPGAVGHDAASLPEARPVQVRRTGFWPVLLGAVVGAGCALGAVYALNNGTIPLPGNTPQIDAAAIRDEAVAAATEAARAVLADQPAPEAAPAPAPDAVTKQDLAALRADLDQQASQLQELAARPVVDPEDARRVAELARQADTLQQQLQQTATAARNSITAAQAEAEKLQEAASASTERAEAVAAVAALQAALDKGVTQDQAQQTLEGAGIDTPEALRRDVPSLTSLQAGFPEAARAALRVSLREDSATGGGNPIMNFLRAQSGARSIQPREGDDADAVLSRANADVEAGRIADALSELDALPEAARAAPAMAEWLTQAQGYRDAQAALDDLSKSAN